MKIGLPGRWEQEDVAPLAYAGDKVLLTIRSSGDGARERMWMWAPGDNELFQSNDRYGLVLGGAGDYGAFELSDKADCYAEVVDVERNDPSLAWQLCGERFVGFSPDARFVLAEYDEADALVVHDVRDGSVVRRIDVSIGGGRRRWGGRPTTPCSTRRPSGKTMKGSSSSGVRSDRSTA